MHNPGEPLKKYFAETATRPPFTPSQEAAGKVIAMGPGVDIARKAAEDIAAGKLKVKVVVRIAVKL